MTNNGSEKYPNIFQSGRIGRLISKNRIKYAATETNFPFGDGYVSDKEVAYMEAQARGGAGIVTTQGAYPDKLGEGKGFKGSMAIYDDRFIPGLARIADVIRKHDALSCLQILHCGREGGVELDYCLMPSIVPQKLSYFKPPREMTKDEIKQAISDHIEAARRAKDAGFDMVELSGIVGYLISTFISRYTNKRTDEYGGDLRSRCRLMIEIIQGVKARVGDIPVGIRLCGHELLDDRGGNTMDESIETFRIAEEAGADFLSVTVGWHESSQSVITRDVPMGHWLPVAEAVKKKVNIPVMMAFRQFFPHIPEKAIAGNRIDFWELCRPMIADPELPVKIKEGRENEIIPCVACNLCFSRLYYHQPIMCTVRPNLGHEAEEDWGYYRFYPAKKNKKIIIIGGGPAGLQCAAVAAGRGHNVILYEKKKELGGSMLLASKVDEGAIELLRPVNTLEALCRKAGVEFRLSKEYTGEMLEDMQKKKEVDAVVIASGSVFKESHNILTPHNIIAEEKKPGRNIVIIGGSGTGLGIAVFLLRNNDYRITIIEEGSKPGRDVNPFYLWQYMGLMKKKNVIFYTRSRVIETGEKTVRFACPKGEIVLNPDSIIMARSEPNKAWHNAFIDITPEVYFIGDAKKPRRLQNAIHDGYRTGMAL
ncbi:MAG: FAD-dependent oxidoreductase [Spirochaetes bacterium]|nr:FAD-dependent oxidoreductase [Spirochaetota bacterium]